MKTPFLHTMTVFIDQSHSLHWYRNVLESFNDIQSSSVYPSYPPVHWCAQSGFHPVLSVLGKYPYKIMLLMVTEIERKGNLYTRIYVESFYPIKRQHSCVSHSESQCFCNLQGHTFIIILSHFHEGPSNNLKKHLGLMWIKWQTWWSFLLRTFVHVWRIVFTIYYSHDKMCAINIPYHLSL